MVISEIKFLSEAIDVLSPDMMKRTNQATSEDAEEGLNRVRMCIAASKFLDTMFQRPMARKFRADWLLESLLVALVRSVRPAPESSAPLPPQFERHLFVINTAKMRHATQKHAGQRMPGTNLP